jgi:hypothetical protein
MAANYIKVLHITMSQRQAKKIRQELRKGMGRELGALQKRFEILCKPCRQWCPLWLWMSIQRRFLNIDSLNVQLDGKRRSQTGS